MQILTERLLLREFLFEDWSVVHSYQNDQRYLRYYPWKVRTHEQVQNFVLDFINQQREIPRKKFQLAIVHKDKGILIGNCGIRIDNQDSFKADIGYELSPVYWGRGFATEAAKAILSFGFDELGIFRIWAQCNADNYASVNVLSKLGFQLEGRLRNDKQIKENWQDTLIFGMQKRDYKDLSIQNIITRVKK